MTPRMHRDIVCTCWNPVCLGEMLNHSNVVRVSPSIVESAPMQYIEYLRKQSSPKRLLDSCPEFEVTEETIVKAVGYLDLSEKGYPRTTRDKIRTTTENNRLDH
jgi:hypothetical protein